MESYLTEREAAKHTRRSVRTLQRERVNPGNDPLPFVKAGPRRVLYRLSDIEDWLARRTFRSTAEVDAAGSITEQTAFPQPQ